MKLVKVLAIVAIVLLTMLAIQFMAALASEASNAAFFGGIVGIFAVIMVGGWAINGLLKSLYHERTKEKQCKTNPENTQQSS